MAPQMMAAWKLLDRDSLRALLEVPKQGLPAAVVLTPDHAADALAAIPMLIAVRQMITRAVEQDGLALTATGALSRADTRALFDLLEWPDYSKQEVLAVNRVLNEADV